MQRLSERFARQSNAKLEEAGRSSAGNIADNCTPHTPNMSVAGFVAANMSDTLPNQFLQYLRQNPHILDACLQRRLFEVCVVVVRHLFVQNLQNFHLTSELQPVNIRSPFATSRPICRLSSKPWDAHGFH